MGRSRLATWTEQHKGRVGRRSATYPFLPGPRAHETTTTSPLPGLLLSCACAAVPQTPQHDNSCTRRPCEVCTVHALQGPERDAMGGGWPDRGGRAQEAEPIDHDQLGRMLRRRQMYTMCINGLL